MRPTLVLTCGESLPPPLAVFGARLRAADIYDLERLHLPAYAGLLIPFHADQRFLLTQQEHVLRFLAAGGTLVVCAQVGYPFLPELASFVPLAARAAADWRVRRVAPHPVFAGVETDDLTFRKGIAGFYGRGHMPPPTGARIIHCLGDGDGAPVDYVYDHARGGRVLVHAGNDLWTYAVEADSTAQRLAGQLLTWIESFECHRS